MLGVKEKFFLIQKNTIEKGPWNCSEGTIWGYHTVAMLGVKENKFFLIQKNSIEKGPGIVVKEQSEGIRQ